MGHSCSTGTRSSMSGRSSRSTDRALLTGPLSRSIKLTTARAVSPFVRWRSRPGVHGVRDAVCAMGRPYARANSPRHPGPRHHAGEPVARRHRVDRLGREFWAIHRRSVCRPTKPSTDMPRRSRAARTVSTLMEAANRPAPRRESWCCGDTSAIRRVWRGTRVLYTRTAALVLAGRRRP